VRSDAAGIANIMPPAAGEFSLSARSDVRIPIDGEGAEVPRVVLRLEVVTLSDDWGRVEDPWRASFHLAWAAFAAGTIPVGAVVVDETGRIAAEGRNRIFDDAAPAGQLAATRLAHAELNALAQLSNFRRWGTCTLYTTLEPCPLCVTATSLASVGRIRYAGVDPYSGGSALIDADLVTPRPLGVTIEGPLHSSLESLATALHLAFFLSRDTGNSSALIETYRERRPEVFPLAATLIGLRHRAGFEDALVALDDSARSDFKGHS
jgi:tRNA(adenine34) deaminase